MCPDLLSYERQYKHSVLDFGAWGESWGLLRAEQHETPEGCEAQSQGRQPAMGHGDGGGRGACPQGGEELLQNQ